MRSLSLLAVCLTAGCYSYLPLATSTPDPGTGVEVTLTDAGARELERALGTDVLRVRGRYVSTDERGLVVSVTAVETKSGDFRSWAGETVTLPTADIVSVDVRRLAKGRSILLAGVGAAGVVVTTLAFTLSGGGTPQDVGRRPPPQ